MTGVFFAGPDPVVRPLAPEPYGQGAHLADELALARLCFQRLGRAGESVDLDARIDARSRAIADRVVVTPLASSALLDLGDRLNLTEAEPRIVVACLAAQLDPSLLPSTDARTTPRYLTPQVLHAVLAPSQPMTDWLCHFVGRGSLVDRRVLLAQPEVLVTSGDTVVLNPFVMAMLLGRSGIDPCVVDAVKIQSAGRQVDEIAPGEDRLVRAFAPDSVGHSLWLLGAERLGLQGLLERLARYVGRPLLDVDVEAMAARRVAMAPALAAVRLMQQVTYAVCVVRLRLSLEENPQRAEVLRWLRALDLDTGPVVVTSPAAHPQLAELLGSALVHTLPPLHAEARFEVWNTLLERVGVELPSTSIQRLSDDFALGPAEIGDAVTNVFRNIAADRIDEQVLRHACMVRLGSRLGRVADRVVTNFAWRDLVLPEDELYQLREMVTYQQFRDQVFLQWNMESKLPYGGGTAALFWGPPGTGKTMAASVIANALGRELYRVDLSRVVDKYIGETEKNLAAVFDAAAESHSVLLFDEADSLFARRTGVSSSNDRYANLETNFLLQRMESHPGITILTTNQLKAIDEAFLRRIRFKVEFPFPDAEARAALWIESIPNELPIVADIDPVALGESFELSGGHIRTAVLRAAFHAASRGQPMTHAQLVEAAQLELHGLGKLVRS